MTFSLASIVQILQFSAVLFSIVLFLNILVQKDRQAHSNQLLLAFLALNTYGLLLFLLIYSGLITSYWFLYRTGLPTSLIVPALVYLYIRSVLYDEQSFRSQDLYHSIPFFIGLIQYAPYFLSSPEYKKSVVESLSTLPNEYALDIGLIDEKWFAILRAIMILFYVVLIIRLLVKSRVTEQIGSGSLKSFEERVYRWLRVFGVTFSINNVAIFFYLVSNSLFSSSQPSVVDAILGGFITLFFNSTLIYYSGYLLLNPETLIGLDKHSRNTRSHFENRSSLEQESELAQDYKMIKTWMEDGKRYLDPSLKLQDVAQAVGLPIRRASFVINSFSGKNFNQMINEYRVLESVRLISEGFLKEYTLDALWSEVGFSNKTSFFKAFKQVMGMTPKQFVLQQDEQTV